MFTAGYGYLRVVARSTRPHAVPELLVYGSVLTDCVDIR